MAENPKIADLWATIEFLLVRVRDIYPIACKTFSTTTIGSLRSRNYPYTNLDIIASIGKWNLSTKAYAQRMSKMTLPDDEFWDAMNSATFHQGDAETTEKILFDMASVWRSEQNYFAAGYAMEYASRAAQGNQEKMLSHFEAAAQDFENCANSQSPDSYSSMAGLLKLSSLLGQGRWTFGLRTQVLCENILEELGQRLISYYHDSSNKVGFLVTGVRLETDLATSWEAKITQYEVRLGEERWGNGILSINLPSAFQIFVMLGDYQ
mgnify:FL=1